MLKEIFKESDESVVKKVLSKDKAAKRVSKQLLRSAYFGTSSQKKTEECWNGKEKAQNDRQKRAWELERRLQESVLKDYREMFGIYLKALTQEKTTKDKICNTFIVVIKSQYIRCNTILCL
ncbi:hypothetical protein ACP3T3_01215 [Chryseobacterium sp. CBSDS_008]|uniref:hypothetical protein n=1 Tax=Chryseobacterium sp. CBSDS_008 TaxID=3415265 RepID=UPI003CF77494